MKRIISTLLLLFCVASVDAINDPPNYFKDMLIVDYWNRRINDRLPVTYNHWQQGGYLNMPSARMGQEGEIGFGYSSVPPYRVYSLRGQVIDRLEVTSNYRIFRGIDDPILTPLGFGDLSDKGINAKLSLFCPEDSQYQLPGIAVGIDDFIGTKNFKAEYVVLTQVFLDYDCEFSIGYGWDRIRRGFGGMAWIPFRRCGNPYLQGITLVAEYDAVPYKSSRIEKHPKGRDKKSPFNFGIKYRLWDNIDFSLAYVRGKHFAFSASAFYNFGMTKGLVVKYQDPLPYNAPVNLEPIGYRRTEDMLAQDLLYAMRRQGFALLELSLSCDDCGQKILRLQVVNLAYLAEHYVRIRLNHLLASLIPSNIDYVIVTIQSEGFPIQEYRYSMEYVWQYGEKQMGGHELRVLTPLCEASRPNICCTRVLFKQNRNLLNVELLPKTHTFFGSSKGKFKYALGVNLGINGYIGNDIYYSILLGYTFASRLGDLTGIDRLNPSQLPNVRTDIIEYYKQRSITVDQAYLQKSWNLGRGFYSRVALGIFEEEYGGVAGEVLYYPVHANWAIGIEGAWLKKRTFSGLGFTDKIRQLHGFVPFHKRFRWSQYFLDLYYEWKEAKLDFKIMIGKFLANDKGARFEVTRYFPSGLRISAWYTTTDGHDKINGRTYHDKGVGFSMPLDIFYTYSDRSRWGYGMSAWLRDVGVFAETGLRLYPLIREERD